MLTTANTTGRMPVNGGQAGAVGRGEEILDEIVARRYSAVGDLPRLDLYCGEAVRVVERRGPDLTTRASIFRFS